MHEPHLGILRLGGSWSTGWHWFSSCICKGSFPTWRSNALHACTLGSVWQKNQYKIPTGICVSQEGLEAPYCTQWYLLWTKPKSGNVGNATSLFVHCGEKQPSQVTNTSTVQLVFKIDSFMVLCLFLAWQLHLLAIKAITTTQVLHFVTDSSCLAYIIQHLYKY